MNDDYTVQQCYDLLRSMGYYIPPEGLPKVKPPCNENKGPISFDGNIEDFLDSLKDGI